MALTIRSGSNEILINYVAYDADSNSFFCYENHDSEPIFKQQLPFEIEELPSPDFTEKLYLFKNVHYNGKRILKIKFNDKPGSNKHVGYIFLLEDIINSPEIFDNIHIKKVAFNVISKLLMGKDISLASNPTLYRQDSNYEISDFYDSDLIIVAICDQLVMFPEYSFDKYLFDFFKFGFHLSPGYNFFPHESACSTIKRNFEEIQTSIHLIGITNNLHQNFFINSLLKNDIFFKDNEVARFHLYYQVLEMLMEKVFKSEVSLEIISNFEHLSSFDIKEVFRDTMKESFSLSKLLGANYSEIDDNIKQELKLNISSFLSYIQINFQIDDLHSKIYKVRNVLFHSYSKVLENTALDKHQISHLLRIVNDIFQSLIVNLISTYRRREIIAPVPTAAASIIAT